jgi:acyl-CoA carboxylase epsilon subunit-like protein
VTTSVPSIQVLKGEAGAEELAALTAVLLAGSARRSVPDGESARAASLRAGWQRTGHTSGYGAPQSWRT